MEWLPATAMTLSAGHGPRPQAQLACRLSDWASGDMGDVSRMLDTSANPFVKTAQPAHGGVSRYHPLMRVAYALGLVSVSKKDTVVRPAVDSAAAARGIGTAATASVHGSFRSPRRLGVHTP